ncbi:MAG TPA: hypothetical protein VGA39_00310, partial [Candidatus Acidoferrales bacterium]
MKRIGSVGLILVIVLLTSAVLQAQDDILPRGEPRVRPVAPTRAPVAAAAPTATATTAPAGVPSMTAPDAFSPPELTELDAVDNFEEAFRIVAH